MSSAYKNMIQCFFSEFVATFIYLFVGCMGLKETNTIFQTSLNMALVVMIVIQCFGHISGGHINPVVTVAAYLNDVIKLPMLIVYCCAQLLGSLAGYGLLLVVVSLPVSNDFCMTLPLEESNEWQIFVVEFIVSSILVLACCAVWDSSNIKNSDSVPLRLGLTVGCLIFSSINLSGGSMNPVRSFGPAMWLLNFKHQWIYWVAPLSSSVVTSYIYKYSFKTDDLRAEQLSIASVD